MLPEREESISAINYRIPKGGKLRVDAAFYATIRSR
jgi:hypothetical protein